MGTSLALAVRAGLLGFRSADFIYWLNDWYRRLQYDGFAALQRDFFDYNPTYLYLLLAVSRIFPGLPNLLAVKFPSIIGDIACAIAAQRIVALRAKGAKLPFFAYMAVLLSPPVILNSAFWGQSDSLYAAGVLACLYWILRRRPWFALTCYGIALALKLQAVFFLPVLSVLWLRGRLKWRHFLPVPLVLALALVPAAAAGRSLRNLAGIYPRLIWSNQELSLLTLNAPTLYAWLPPDAEFYRYFMPAGVLFGAAIILLFILFMATDGGTLRRKTLVAVSTLCMLMVPFVLPSMHERYFYGGNLLAIIFAFYFPRWYYVPLLGTMVEFFAYGPFLFGEKWMPIPMPILALAMLLTILIVARGVDVELHATSGKPGVLTSVGGERPR